MNNEQINYIKQLKEDKTVAPMIENNFIEGYKIEILNRGEELFYYDINQDRAIIVSIQVRNGSIFQKSISVWDTRKKITEDEKLLILNRIVNYFQKFQNKEAIVR